MFFAFYSLVVFVFNVLFRKIPFESPCHPLVPDIDECETNSHHCNPTQVCINTAGGYTCSCTEGYWLIGGQCQGG